MLLVACSHAAADAGPFILRQAAKFGLRIVQTNDLPTLSGEWRYKEDAGGFQISIRGDHFAELQTFLTAAFGPPAKPATTNEWLGTKSVGTYYGAQIGGALSYRWETTRDGKQFTSMVVVKREALREALGR